jgi:hypothetical protein
MGYVMTAQFDPDAIIARNYRQKAKDARDRAAALSLGSEFAPHWQAIAGSYDRLAELSEKLARERRGLV